ncbi:MAG: double-strand break repair protein AddB [Gemmobacter sp.]|uniref:double-strand break repair protein AddB n=1 Tax=Gemmobacter sp. TaxID=1898957 RepID=UPI00391C7D5B
MFDSGEARVFGLPPGVDFAAALVAGLRSRLSAAPPEAMARVTLWVNSSRMRERVKAQFRGPDLLPRIRLVTELAEAHPLPHLPAPEPALRRRLQLTQLIARLLDAEPDLAPRSALYDLADSLANLMDEMAGEGASPEAVAALDVSDHSLHWARTQRFLGIVAPFFGPDASPQAETRRRMVAERLGAIWATRPPPGPVIVAGSTGSRGATALMMQAVAGLPQGALVLPGHDFAMPPTVWDHLGDALTAEDHPQYRTRRLLDRLGLTAAAVRPWTDDPAPAPGRNALVSLALRPAPVTDQWLSEGATLPDLVPATAGMTLIEAPSPRAEALAIALILREAAEVGRVAALVTPDRDLARQVTVALDRWGIVPDDSAGRPLMLTPPGRLLRQVAGLFGQRITGDRLLALLKHPLVHTGTDRGDHLRLTRDLELHLRRKGPAFPDAGFLRVWGAAHKAEAWAGWLADRIAGLDSVAERPLADHLTHHRALAEALCAGPVPGSGELWLQAPGEAAQAALAALEAEAAHGGTLAPHDYAALFDAVLAGQEVRETAAPHPLIRIQGAREARELSAGLVILGGLNDGGWPQLPPPDPWLNRQMRLKAGLLLPERRIGLAAHDFQQAIAAPEVVLTRAARSDEAECVPSRWLNRLVNLMQGLPDRNGPQALAAMKARGAVWLGMARALERPAATVPRAPRPSPCPPVAARPVELAVTGIETLIRDPYAIYARHILRLRGLDPLRASPDARLRGTALHKVMEAFARDGRGTAAALMTAADAVLEAEVPWPAARVLWRARLARVADWVAAFEADHAGTPELLETPGAVTLPGLGFRLTARPDRIDRLADGRLHIYDYKTSSPPTAEQQAYFNQQLALQAAMARQGGFARLGPAEVAAATYVGLGATPKAVPVDVTPEGLDRVWSGLIRLIATYQQADTGYTARRAMFRTSFASDYDALSRHGEWDMADAAVRLVVGGAP